MKTKIRKTIIVVLIAVCCGVCLALGMANISSDKENRTTAYAATNDVTTDDGLILTASDGTYIVSGVTSGTVSVNIPDTYGGVSVTAIADDAFFGNTKITDLVISDSITSLPEGMLSGCSCLTSLSIPYAGSGVGASSASASTLFGYIFGQDYYDGGIATVQYYSSSKSVTYYIPEALTDVTIRGGKILYGAFYGCENIKNLTIGEDVTSLEKYAFYGCKGLENIYYNAVSSDDLSSDNYTFRIGKDTDAVVTIGASVTKIPAYLFYPYSGTSSQKPTQTGITGLVWEQGCQCEEIGACAFNYTKLSEVTVPESVISMGGNAFANCNLSKVYYNASCDSKSTSYFSTNSTYTGKTEIYIGSNVPVIPEYFAGCESRSWFNSLVSVTFEEGSQCTYIGSYAFAYADVTTIEIPEKVETIGSYAFWHLENNETVYYNAISASMSIKGSTFARTSSSRFNVIVGANVEELPSQLFDSNGSSVNDTLYISSVEFEPGSHCTSIGRRCFYNTKMTSITIPSSVNCINSQAFYITQLSSAVFEDTHGWYCSDCDFSSADLSDASTAAKYLRSYTGTWNKEAVEIFEYTLSSEGTYYILTSFNNDGYTSITIDATYNSLPVKEIAPSVFEGHTEITSVTISENITTIGDYAFSGCTYVTKIYFNATAMNDLESNNGVFYNTGKKGGGITVTIGANVTRIPAYFLCPYTVSNSYAPNVKTVTFQSGSECTEIGEYAFIYCGFSEFSIPSGVTYIGTYAFASTYITSVTIPSAVKTVGSEAFGGCSYLEEIYFNATAMDDLEADSLVFWSDYSGSSNVTITVTIGANVTRIPANLFATSVISILGIEIVCAPRVTTVIFESGSQCTEIGADAFYTGYISELYVDDLASYLSIDFAGVFANPLFFVSANGGTFYVGGLETTKLTVENTAGVTRIGSYALAYCTIISDIVIGENVSYIGNNAFEGMSGLDSFALASCSGWSVYASGSSSGTTIAAQDLQTNALEYFTSVYVAYTWEHTLKSTVAPVISSAVGNGDFTSVGFDVYVSVDSGSSIYCVYCVKPDGTVEYFYGMSSISVDSPMNGTYEIYAEDTEGTLSESYFIVFDDVAPELYLGGGAAWANYNSSEFSVLALDNLDSDVRLWYSLTGENGSWQLCDSNPFTISPNEAYSTDGRYWFVAVDAAGNVTGPYYTVLDAMPVEGYWEQGDDMFYYFRYEAPSYSEWTCTVNGAAYVSGTPFTTDCTTYDIVLTGANGTTYEISQYLDHYFPEEGEYHEATCTEQAYTTYTCIYCGSYYTVYDPYSSAGDHNYVLELVEPTCTESGHSQYVCTDCGATTGFSYIAPLGHDWSNSEVSIEPTCTTNGFIGQICQRCGAQNEYGEVIPATGHNFVNDEDFYTAPTCTEKGRSRNVCLNCHEMGDVTETPALGHLLITETLPATCTEYGYSKTYCTREGCDYETSTSSDGYLASHTWSDEPVERRDATCTEDGCLVYVCTVCGERDERTISAFGHSYEIVTDSAKWTFPGTITIDGTVYKVIDSYWNDGEAYVVVNRGGETDEVVPVWCKRCTVCGDTFLDYKTDAKETGNRVTEIFEKYQKYLWWILLALVVVWSLFIGLRWALQRNDQEKVKTRSMLANYVLGLFVIAVIIVGLPYLVYGIAILVG